MQSYIWYRNVALCQKNLAGSRNSHPVAGAIWAQMPNVLYNLAFEKPAADALNPSRIPIWKACPHIPTRATTSTYVFTWWVRGIWDEIAIFATTSCCFWALIEQNAGSKWFVLVSHHQSIGGSQDSRAIPNISCDYDPAPQSRAILNTILLSTIINLLYG